MSQKFQAGIHQRDGVTFIKLSGVIDEDNELADLTDKIGAGTAVIDLAEIERINSCGVRDWVNWLGSLEGKGDIVLVECSPAIVAQINLVNNFTGSGAVKSFYVPYFCPECDEEKVLLCEAADMGPPPHEPPTCRCDECDLVMDFDDMPDSYFAFLANQKKVASTKADSKVSEVLDEFAPKDGDKSRIRSRIGGSATISGGSGSSLPSVPSLPSISRPGIPTGKSGNYGGFGKDKRPPAVASTSHTATAGEGGKSHTAVYVMVAVLLAAIAALAFLLLGN